ncbi:U2 small nuclear ribonucleoprotein auxiliary factor 35 kDa subunit-related protein 2 isoform X2 [Zootermopsis nevadensis]|uniref:U2 small nuclear ribonucleoprotein auxiliary factor 35 kDa subunit-related protein 1 n=1 Tax=Zootermopsis nevadensis TaxID=136037 RepID=A0A067RL47_ZOONE|nr:U2 small nuclear ribonucleoprotein auxiliary factor 35 kDa subunit-related protein 2 isoform X2 [Zootermopsis nevadensis]KDR21330.1 U2 small nuclear ribonucleoprotein auxiliary factor 35 kDa subunit-related protein 1 [Zootermopsis nevadensis]
MGRHKVWRALAKKMRRKRIRQALAQKRDDLLQKEQEKREKSPRYQAWLAEQNVLEEFRHEEESRLQTERDRQWERDEELAQRQWLERQERLAQAREEKTKQELKIREEWELEQKKLKEVEEEERRKQEEKLQKQEDLMRQIDDFIKHGGELPPSVNISTETHPDKPICPFFSKTGACRFGDRCSRNHPRPGISKVLLIPNFYSHFGIDQSMIDEYDTDLMLEYDDRETYQHFREFYEDVLPEFEQCGRVVQFKVCCNCEPHLRGNVYVEYASTRDAVGAFQKFQGRWYGGRQLNVEFTCVSSWKSAICGLFFKRRCPKGRSCNFLHVFHNPANAFAGADHDYGYSRRQWKHSSRSRSRSRSRSPSRKRSRRNKDDRNNWRWSETPEPSAGSVNGDSKQNRDQNSEKIQSQRRRKVKDKETRRRRRSCRTSDSHRKERRRKSSPSHSVSK